MAAIPILILLLLTSLAARHLVRTFYYPSPTHLPAIVDGEMSESLRHFESVLAEHVPAALAALQAGLSEEQIDELSQDFGVRLSDEVKSLYRWRNGSPPDPHAQIIPGHRFVPLEEALQTRHGILRQVSDASFVQRVVFAIVAGHRSAWVNIFEDGCGDGYFFDPARRRRRCAFFYHFAEITCYRYFPSLKNFLAGAADCYTSGVYRSRRDGRLEADAEREFELWRNYATKTG